jgi:hypothetical protein
VPAAQPMPYGLPAQLFPSYAPQEQASWLPPSHAPAQHGYPAPQEASWLPASQPNAYAPPQHYPAPQMALPPHPFAGHGVYGAPTPLFMHQGGYGGWGWDGHS